MHLKSSLLLSLLLLLFTPLTTARATTLPPNFFEWQLATLPGPVTTMEFAPDGRLFVLQQDGVIRVIKEGALLPEPAAILGVNTSGERGLLGITFDPDFLTNGYVYLYYTELGTPPHNRLTRFTVTGDTIDLASGRPLLDLPGLDAFVHNGGAIHFGPDGMLYVAVGENAVGSNAQSLETPLGKILRISPDGTIPDDNPFVDSTTGINQSIWAMGLRNPYSFAFDPLTGAMLINDVGADGWEEIDAGLAGANYGWPATEGDFSQAAYPDFTRPVYAYPHNPACAITGAAFYRPEIMQFPAEYLGDYFFADYCAAWIQVYDPVTGTVQPFESDTTGEIVDVDISPDGSLLYLSRTNSSVMVVQYSANPLPVFSQHPQSQTVSVGRPVSLTCQTSDPTSRIQWQRSSGSDFVDLFGETATTLTIAAAAFSDDGAQFRCIAINANGSSVSSAATLTVVSNLPPAAIITTPTLGATYQAGDWISYSGSASDPEDGSLPTSAFTWQVDFHHYNLTPADAHTHPLVPATTGAASGTFNVPVVGETSPNVWYRIILTVTDSGGMSAAATRDVYPKTVAMIFRTSPPGLSFLLDGQQHLSPYTTRGVVGVIRSRQAIRLQTMGGRTWRFTGWASGGQTVPDGLFSTPATDTAYVATFALDLAAPLNP